MRYLYGDSAPFPHTFNFLATLERFMAAATKVVKLESEARSLESTTASAAAARVKSLDELETFHESVIAGIQESARRATQRQTADYALQVVEHAVRLLEDARRTTTATNEREQAQVRAEVERRRGEIRLALEGFLTTGPLPILDAVIKSRWDGRYVMSCVLTNPDGIVSFYELGASKADAKWQQPRRVGDFAQGVNLMVGVRKSLFRRSSQPELVQVDDHLVSSFDLTDSTAEIRLRRRIHERDALIFTMRRDGSELAAEVSHPSEEGPEALPAPVDTGDKMHLSRLWQSLRAAVDPMLEQREKLLGLKLEGEDVFENDLAIMLVERVVRFLGPMVAEISRRSPNPRELSLKMENDAGRREEVYVKKEDLIAHLSGMGERELSIFAPLGFSPPPSAIAGGVSSNNANAVEIHFDDWEK
ncbi:hypothetical protein LVJ94_41030 [Pendulispora rubella]|uniref:Uncharacterized protein n=1 Tax=Pendulispora rubella TaxID=2741070 RepID=A0ABZ2KXI4_9BACT